MNKPIEQKIANIILKIRTQRLVKNYTQTYVGEQLGISQNAYSKIEIGHTKVTLEALFKIVQILEMDIVELLK